MELMVVVLGFLIAGLIAGLFLLEASHKKQGDPILEPVMTDSPGKPCPLCGTALNRGQRVHSVIFQTRTADKLMEIWGCPFCSSKHPSPEGKPKFTRYCPVCKKTLEADIPVSARVFTKKDGKQHVHVLGCPNCRRSTR